MSLPKYSTVPRVGFNAPVTILMSVVFPAPFGPIRAVRAPTGSEKQMSDATVSAPNCLSRFLMARASTMTDPLAAQPRADLIKAVDDAAGHNQHYRDQHAADREHPAERVEFGGDMMDEHKQQGSDQRPPQPAGTAEDQHPRRFGARRKAQAVQTDHLNRLCRQGACNAGEETTKRISRRQMALHVTAHRGHSHPVFPDTFAGQSERRAHHTAQNKHAERQHGHAVDESGLAEDVERKGTEDRTQLDS